MTRTLLALLMALSATGLDAQGVSEGPVAEPQYINSFAALDANGKLSDLERVHVTFHTSSHVLPGYYSFTQRTEFKPGHSPVRESPTVRFVVRGRSGLDPASLYQLQLLKGSKSHREFTTFAGHGSVLGGSSRSDLSPGEVPIRFEEYGAASFRITPEHPLAPGEYALAMRGLVTELYCFGVDK